MQPQHHSAFRAWTSLVGIGNKKKSCGVDRPNCGDQGGLREAETSQLTLVDWQEKHPYRKILLHQSTLVLLQKSLGAKPSSGMALEK